MKLVEQLLSKYNFPIRNRKSRTIVKEIEEIVHFQLPVDYLAYALKYSGFEAVIGVEFVRLWDFDELIQTNTDYQIFTHLPKTLGIGGNGSSEFIAIEQAGNGSMRVVLSPIIDLDTQYHIEIGTSFTDFLKRLDDGEAWFK